MIKVLHVLTLIGNNGQYGGPVTVARGIKSELQKSNKFEIKIIAGSLGSNENQFTDELLVAVRKLIPTKTVSSLFSIKIAIVLIREIRKSDLVHLHFARDVVQIFAGFISLILNKPYITQTHGMIRKKNFFITYMFDFLFIKPILRNAECNLVLTNNEKAQLKQILPKLKIIIIGNGIEYSYLRNPTQRREIVVVFCARLHKTKGLDIFIDLAKQMRDEPNVSFKVFGPDGGELSNLLNVISEKKYNLTYGGALSPWEVERELRASDLLVLPSQYDPFPMIVLEALAIGLPVVVSSNCGQSVEVAKINKDYVAERNSSEVFKLLLKKLMTENMHRDRIRSISEESRKYFDIQNICKSIESIYENCL